MKFRLDRFSLRLKRAAAPAAPRRLHAVPQGTEARGFALGGAQQLEQFNIWSTILTQMCLLYRKNPAPAAG